MAKLSAHGTEIARYLSNGWLLSVRDDGTTLRQTTYDRAWKVYRTKKADVTLEAWRAARMAKIAALPAWQRQVKCLPSTRRLEAWVNDGACETPTGHCVEPDGVGPDGVISWLMLLGLI